MQRPHLVSASVALILMIMVLPADASAKPGYAVHPASIQFILPVKKAIGYVMSVSADGQQRVQFKVDGPSLESEYSTSGNVSSQRIEANFGTMGQINVRLHLNLYPPDPPHEGRCKGRAPRYQEGSYRGTIEFADEGSDAPRVSAMHGRVYVIRRFRQVCRRLRIRAPKSGTEELKGEIGILKVMGREKGRRVTLQALEFIPTGKPIRSEGYFTATVFERNHGIRITRRTGTPLNHRLFALSRPGAIPETAEIELAKPFIGHAFYSSSPGTTPNWTGDFSIDLPVVGKIPLTGPTFSAMLCRAVSVTTLESCRRA
jgi:hypothetical protein